MSFFRTCLTAAMATVALAACGGDSGSKALDLDGGNAVVDSGPVAEASSCTTATLGTVQACTCATGATGTQRCLETGWNECFCVAPVVDAGPPVAGEVRCRAGYYEGNFDGEYWSGVFADPITMMSWFSVPIEAGGSSDTPGLGLTLDEEVISDGEFEYRKVRDGCVIGIADAYGLPNPFVGVLTGTLDCTTGIFEGSLKGYYNLLTSGITFPFEGPVSSRFENDALVDGKWMVEENQNSASPPGGNGDWMVTRVGDVSAAPPLPEECMAIIAESGGGTPDAGVVDAGPQDSGSTTLDAGVGDGG